MAVEVLRILSEPSFEYTASLDYLFWAESFLPDTEPYSEVVDIIWQSKRPLAEALRQS